MASQGTDSLSSPQGYVASFSKLSIKEPPNPEPVLDGTFVLPQASESSMSSSTATAPISGFAFEPVAAWQEILQFLPSSVLEKKLTTPKRPFQDYHKPTKGFMEAAPSLRANVRPTKEKGSDWGNNCENPFSPKHDIYCGHTITTQPSTYLESHSRPSSKQLIEQGQRKPCGPNCVRPTTTIMQNDDSAVPHFSDRPFLCPMCIEKFIRKRYTQAYRKLRNSGVVKDYYGKEDNIKTFTHYVINYCLEDNEFRVTETADGRGVYKIAQMTLFTVNRKAVEEVFGDVQEISEAREGYDEEDSIEEDSRGRGYGRQIRPWGRSARSRSPVEGDYDDDTDPRDYRNRENCGQECCNPWLPAPTTSVPKHYSSGRRQYSSGRGQYISGRGQYSSGRRHYSSAQKHTTKDKVLNRGGFSPIRKSIIYNARVEGLANRFSDLKVGSEQPSMNSLVTRLQDMSANEKGIDENEDKYEDEEL